MGNVPVMPLLHAFGWLILLSFASGLLLWPTLARAVSKAPQRPEVPRGHIPPISKATQLYLRRVLDLSYRVHIHEAGHVIAHWHNPYTTHVSGAVAFRNGTGFTGFTHERHTESTTASTVWYNTRASLSGLVAEIIIFGKAQVRGSEFDLRYARQHIERILARDSRLMDTTPWLDALPASSATKSIGRLYSEPPEPAVTLVLDKAYAHTKSFLRAHQDQLKAIAFAIKDGCGHISNEEIEAILGPRPHH